jgi:hypothetical protein
MTDDEVYNELVRRTDAIFDKIVAEAKQSVEAHIETVNATFKNHLRLIESERQRLREQIRLRREGLWAERPQTRH